MASPSLPVVIYLSLDKSDAFETRYASLTRQLSAYASVVEALTPEEFLKHSEDPNVIGVIVSDAAIINDHNSETNKTINQTLVSLAKDRGVAVIYGLDFPRRMLEGEVMEGAEVLPFTPDPKSIMVQPAAVEAYMKVNWGVIWCPDDWARPDCEITYFDQSILYGPLKKNVNIAKEMRMWLVRVRQVEDDSHRVMIEDEYTDAAAAAFKKFGNGYVGMTADLDGNDAMVPCYIAMLGFWGR
ncbi:hypothetical protein FQN54_001858 [Arachnomyces sp. PD_36]|nr:hypothetical protein FQN54_001858 [Arachnomyces sp. PD_36]